MNNNIVSYTCTYLQGSSIIGINYQCILPFADSANTVQVSETYFFTIQSYVQSYLLTISYQACRLFGHAMMLSYRVCILNFIFLFVCDKFRSVENTGTVFSFCLNTCRYICRLRYDFLYLPLNCNLIRGYLFMLIDSIFHLHFLYKKSTRVEHMFQTYVKHMSYSTCV